LFGDLQKSKNIDYKVEHPVFSSDEEGRPTISYIDQFPEPQDMEHGNFLQRLSDGLEESKDKIETKLPVGYSVIAIIISGYLAESRSKKIRN
jgi:CsiD.